MTLVTVFTIYSCGSATQLESDVVKNYELQIVDFVQLGLFLESLNVMGVHDKTGEILAIQSDPPVAYLLSPEGKPLKRMDDASDSQEGARQYILSGEFYKEGLPW